MLAVEIAQRSGCGQPNVDIGIATDDILKLWDRDIGRHSLPGFNRSNPNIRAVVIGGIAKGLNRLGAVEFSKQVDAMQAEKQNRVPEDNL